MSDELTKTVRIRRIPKVAEDEHGHSVWTKPVEEVELELVSTTMLKQILTSDEERQRVEKAVEDKDGFLVRNTETSHFEVIDDEDLQAALESAADTPEMPRPADVTLEPLDEASDEEELSLVSTQMLRVMLSGDDPTALDEGDEAMDDGGGFNPYDNA